MLVCLASLSAVAQADTIKIGVAGPFTGTNAAVGEQQWRGAEQAAKDINAAGGIKGRMIEVVKADEACEPRQAVAVANRLASVDKVAAVVGHFCSSSTLPASEIYADADILMVTPGSTNPKVTERKLQNVLRTCGRDDQQGNVAAEFIVKTLAAKRVAVIHDKDTYGQGIADAMRARLNQLGQKEVLYEGLTRGEKDFNALVTKLRGVQADAVYFGGLYAEAGPLVRQMREQGLKAAFISGDGIVSKELIAAAGGAQYVEGVYMTFGADPRNIPEGKTVVAQFRQAGYEPEGYTLYAYAAVQVIAAALQANTTTQGAVLSAWLRAHPVPTVMGLKAWDAKGDLSVSDYIVYRWDAKGEYAEYAPK
jgi:branched-chain amino acid transport system substrate-binding protein